MIIEADARKPLLIAINIENTLFTAEIKVKFNYYSVNYVGTIYPKINTIKKHKSIFLKYYPTFIKY